MQDFDKYLLLEPYEFDQGDNGWRELDKQKKFLEAAQVIEEYLKENKQRVEKYAKENPEYGSVMVFHAGQLYATAGPDYYENAKPFLSKSLRTDDEGWNIYVKGTIAFLEKDSESLDAALSALMARDPEHVRVQFLGRLKEGLKRGATYQQTYNSN